MRRKYSREEQIERFYRRRRMMQFLSVLLAVIARVAAAAVTAVCIYLVFLNADAIEIKGIAAAALAVLLYAQCASLSMVGLRMFSKSACGKKSHLALSSVLICMPLYFVVLVISVIPMTEPAAFFITVFPAVILNILPMESVRDEMAMREFPSVLFWLIQGIMQLLFFSVGQMYGQYLTTVWG